MTNKVTKFLPRIWKKDARKFPLVIFMTRSKISRACNPWTTLRMVTESEMSEVRQLSKLKTTSISVWTSRQTQPIRLTMLTTCSMIYVQLYKNKLNYSIRMTRGNQRDADRERARKRNAENKKGEKSDFNKTKESHAEIMRLKQKKHQEEAEHKPEKGEKKEYQKKEEE